MSFLDEKNYGTFSESPPERSKIEIYLSTMTGEPVLIFALCGEVVLKISNDKFEAKGLAPISTSEELHSLMLDFFQQGKK